MKLTPDEVRDYLLNSGPRTTAEIQTHFATSQTWTSRCIALAKAANLIYINDWRAPMRRGMPKPVFAARTQPDQVDAERVRKSRQVVKQDDGGDPVVVRAAGVDPQHVEQAARNGLWGALRA